MRWSLAAAILLSLPVVAAAQDDPPPGEGGVQQGAGARVTFDEGPGTWRWRMGDRRVKVVVLAGSIGAWLDEPYADRFQAMCSNVEVKNISMPRLGAYGLQQRLEQQVFRNRNVRLGHPEYENWLVFQGGLNSVANSWRTNAHIREIFVMAHRRNMRVVGLTLTPWGDDSDRRRWTGVAAWRYWKSTKAVVDFMMGRLTPRAALGPRSSERPGGADAPWTPAERADVAVDLYDSPLRDRDAALRPADPIRRALLRDPVWQRSVEGLADAERTARLEADVRLATEVPRWFLKRSLRSFDHIHPNREGHRLIAETACPRLPASWGCRCGSR
jgi:hypothetical protein